MATGRTLAADGEASRAPDPRHRGDQPRQRGKALARQQLEEATVTAAAATSEIRQATAGTPYSSDFGDRQCVASNTGFRTHQPVRLHFGLGDADRIDEAVLRWPFGTVQHMWKVPLNQRITITQSS